MTEISSEKGNKSAYLHNRNYQYNNITRMISTHCSKVTHSLLVASPHLPRQAPSMADETNSALKPPQPPKEKQVTVHFQGGPSQP